MAQICAHKARPPGAGEAQVGLGQVGPVEDGAVAYSSIEGGSRTSREVSTGEITGVQQCIGEIRHFGVCSFEGTAPYVRIGKLGDFQVCAIEVCRYQTRIGEVGVSQIRTIEVSTLQISQLEV